MARITIGKQVNVTNPRNVLVQIPGAVIANWGIKTGDRLEVEFNEETNIITIKPAVRCRGDTAKEG